MAMLSLNKNQIKILFIVFICLLAVVTPSCTEGDDYSFETMDDRVTPGSKPKSTEIINPETEEVLTEAKGK